MSGVSEFGGQIGPAGVPKHRSSQSLTARDKLGLRYRTGTTDPKAERDPEIWQGNDKRRYATLPDE